MRSICGRRMVPKSVPDNKCISQRVLHLMFAIERSSYLFYFQSERVNVDMDAGIP